MTTGTNDTEQGLTATETTNDTDFAAIQRAMLEGNTEELNRLMAAEPTKVEEVEEIEEVKEEEDQKTESLQSKPEDTSTEDDKSSEQEDTTEAATSAASTATNGTEDITALKAELHRLKSNAGRVDFLQRRMAELDREVRAYKAREVAPTQSATKVDTSKVEIDPELQKEIDDLKEIDPVMARTLERIAKTAVASANQRVEQAVITMSQHDQEVEDARFYNEQKGKLMELVPQADQIFQSNEWKQWKQGLSPGRLAMAESGYADEVHLAMQAFAADMQRIYGTPAAQVAQTQTPPEKTEVTEARQHKLATTAPTKSHAAKKGEEFDVDAAFREMYNKVAKERHIL